MLVSLVAAGILAAPLPVRELQPAPDDYPAIYFRSDKSAAALIELVITPEGTIAKCRELKIFGDKVFASDLCRLFKPRSWTAAIDEKGEPTSGIVRTLLRFFIPETPAGDNIASLAQGPDVELTVEHLPEPLKGHLDVKLSLAVGPSGAISACEPRPDQKLPLGVSEVACAEASRSIFNRASLPTDTPPSFVIEQMVRFVAEKPTVSAKSP